MTDHVSTERERVITELIARWQRRLRLVDMDIRYSGEAPEPGRRGESHHWPAKNAGVICIAHDAPLEAIENIVVHELLHCLFQGISETYDRAAAEFGPQAKVESDARWEMAEEHAIEKLTTALTGSALRVWPTSEVDAHIVKAFGATE